MVVKKPTEKRINNAIQQFIDDAIFLSNYLKVENLSNRDYNSKLTVKIGKRIEKNATFIIQNNGIEQFLQLLDNDNIIIASTAAEYLYPLYPSKCIGIIKRRAKSIKHPLDRKREEDLIDGLENDKIFFTAHFKTIYENENYKSLSRE